MHFDMNDLRLYVATAELGNLTRAAERQHLSLAAASARIKALEAQCGLPLLTREARGVRLLPQGEAFTIPKRDHMRATGDSKFKAAALDFLGRTFSKTRQS